MILENFCKALNIIICMKNTSGQTVKDTSGTSRVLGFNTRNDGTPSLTFSSDDTDVSMSDYTLNENTGLTYGTITMSKVPEKGIMTLNRTVTNNTSEDITVRKIGVIFRGAVISSAYTTRTYYNFYGMISKLSEPFIIKAGESYNFGYAVVVESDLLTKQFCYLLANTIRGDMGSVSDVKNQTGQTAPQARSSNGSFSLNPAGYSSNPGRNGNINDRGSYLNISDSEADNDTLYDLPLPSEISVSNESVGLYETGRIVCYRATFQNTSSNPITIRKVGCICRIRGCDSNYYESTNDVYNVSNNNALLTVSNLETPITINSGEKYSFEYDIRVD